MGLFGSKKKAAELAPALDADMDVPPKPPEFHIEGPAFPPLELPPAEEQKPTHTDDLSMPAEHPVELPPFEPVGEVQQAIETVQREIPPELPKLKPLAELEHEEYAITPEPAPKEVQMPALAYPERPLGDSILLRDRGPLFITLEGYEQVITNAVKVRADLQNAEDRSVALNALRNREDGAYSRFQQSLEQLSHKLAYIDRMLFGESDE